MSKIEWTGQTWNPVVGCSKVSQGCKHCYAETQFPRHRGRHGYGDSFTDVRLVPGRLQKPLRRKKPTLYFVNSMSDLFHEALTDDEIAQVFEVMCAAHWHTFQVLTKRAERLEAFFRGRLAPDNVWLGVSVENRYQGVPRIDHLRRIRAKTRFLSVEPLIDDVGDLDLDDIHWVIVGGESGHKARAMKPEWARSVRDQCLAQGVAFFLKQWGTFGEDGVRRSKKENGRRLDGVLWDEYPHQRTVAPEHEVAGPSVKPIRQPAAPEPPLGSRMTYESHEEVEQAVRRGFITKNSGAAHKAHITRRLRKAIQPGQSASSSGRPARPATV